MTSDWSAAAGGVPVRTITVDFPTGASDGARPSLSLARGIAQFRDALADLCKKHGTSPAVFRGLAARCSTDSYGDRFLVTIEDHDGRRSVDEYMGIPGRRIKVLDRLGRLRRKQLHRDRALKRRPRVGAAADTAMARRFDALGRLPADRFGHASWLHFKENAYAFPGDPIALNAAFCVPHESAHVLSHYDSSPRRTSGLHFHRRHAP